MLFKSKPWKFLFALILWAFPATLPAVTPPIPERPSQYVVDLAGVLAPEAQVKLNAMLKDLEDKTMAQVVVLTINSLDGEPIENFSHQTAVKWKIGQKGKDNGVLITVAVKDRKYRLEVGYGLESTLPDSLVGSIGRQYLVPNFKKGLFAAGIAAAVSEVVKAISGGKAGAVTPKYHWETVPQKEGEEGSGQLTLVLVIIFIILMLGALALIIPRLWARRGGRAWSGGGFWAGGSSSGWSSGGGSSGGFSGGGGDFGGGGASGDW